MDIKNSMYNVVSRKDTSTKTAQEIVEYIGCEFNDAGEFHTGMVEMRLMPLTKPTAPTDEDAIKFELWKMVHRAYEKQTKACHHNSYRVYALVLGQCSQALCNRMEASETWGRINDASDMMGLWQLIQNCMIKCQTQQPEACSQPT